jgi:hypothetical protein
VRWGHAVVWLTLAAMCSVLSVGRDGQALVAPLGLIALATYLAFVAALPASRRG